MDNKDLFIKSKLQEDKNIPKEIDELIKNFKGGDIKMENNFNNNGKSKIAKIIAIAACFILVALVGVVLLGQQNGQIIKVGGKDKVEGRKDLNLTDNNQSIATKKVSFGKLDEILSNELFKGGNVASNNKIKSVIVNEITIYTNEYCEVQNMGYLSEEYKDKIVGYCVYTMEFENIQGLSLAGSKGEPYGTYENALLNGTTFVYNPERNKIEIGNELEFVKDKGNNGHNIYDIELDNTLGNVRFNAVYKKIYNDLATGGIVASNNKIKKIFINSITIYTDRYTQITGKTGEPKEIDTDVVGNYVFTMEFENIEGLELAGGRGHIYGTIENCLVNSNSYLYHQEEDPYEVRNYLETTETDEDKIIILNKSNIHSYLGTMSSRFCIENIEKNGDKYIITAYLLDVNRIVSKTEMEDLKAGKEITFRNKKWKMDTESNGDKVLVSGEDRLHLIENTTNGTGRIDNMAGAAVEEGLKDYSIKVKFEVESNILIGSIWNDFKFDNNGNVVAYENDEVVNNFTSITFERLLEMSQKNIGTYEECQAFINNGDVKAIKLFNY